MVRRRSFSQQYTKKANLIAGTFSEVHSEELRTRQLFQEKLNAYKQDFSKANLLVPEETYIDLKNKPYEHQSLKEFIQVRVYESLADYVQELD